MKILAALCVLVTVASSSAKPGEWRECIYVEGQCVSECEEGTHSYTTGCDYVIPEPTCDKPNPKPQDFETCDYTDCYCNSPTVRDTVSGKCVALDECPKKLSKL